MILDEWQEEILKYDGNFILCTGRQVGKTTIMASKAANYMIKNKGAKIIIVSLTEDQAKLIIVMILDYLEKHAKTQIQKGKHKPTQNRVTLKNKSTAIARPVGNTGDAVRGFTGDVLIIDEMSRMPELAFQAAKPTLLTTAGQIWGCSTPHGKSGYFWECFMNKHNRFKVWHISSEEVMRARPINEYWTERKRAEAIKFLEEEKKDMSEIHYSQEYLGEFMDELRQLFSDELIRECMTLKRLTTPDIKADYFLGCDIARFGGDQSTFEIIERKDKKFLHRENIVKTRLPTTESESIILSLNMMWNVAKIGIDAGAGALGVGLYDRFMENAETKRKVVAMNNRTIALEKDGKKTQRIMKEDFYDNLLGMMQRKEIELLDDNEVFLSLKSVQYEFVISQDKPSKMRIFGKFTHIAEGLIRAAYLAKKEKVNKLWIAAI